MDFEHLIVKDEAGIAEITLNRPDRRNALSFALIEELTAALDQQDADVIVISGAGPCFSGGHDAAEMVAQPVAFYRNLFDACTTMMQTIQGVRQPVIAKVHGYASAAGCQLAASCDLVVADQEARFATPGVKIGLFCSTPMVPLSRCIGRKRAMEMLLTGEFIDAGTAAEWGLVNRVVPSAELDEAVMTLARQIADASPLAIGIGKETFYRQVDLDERQAYDLAKTAITMNSMAADAQEGLCAFLEKRKPTWTGT